MKKKDIEKLLLLRATGEITAAQNTELENELAREKSVADRIETELAQIFESVQSDDSATRVKASSMAAIKNAARRELAKEDRHPQLRIADSFLKLWRPALLYSAAALFLLFLTIPIWNHYSDRSGNSSPDLTIKWGSELDENLSELDEEISIALLEYAELADEDRSLEELASELIELKETEI